MPSLLKHTALTLLTLFSLTAQGQTSLHARFKVLPINNISYLGKDLFINYALPCGNEKVGLVVATNLDKKLRLGILAEQSSVLCAGMPRVVNERIAFVDYSGIDVIVKMAPMGFKNNLRISPALDLRVLAKKGKQPDVQTVYKSDCANFEGYVISGSPNKQLRIGFLESQNKNTAGKKCQVKQSIKNLSFLKVKKQTKVAALDYNKTEPESAFHLRMTKIKPTRLTHYDDGSTEFFYLRHCNEAPAGVVVGNVGAKNVSLGMLVAHFYNRSCMKSQKPVWSKYRTKGVFLRTNQKITFFSPSKGLGRYRVVAPTQYAVDTRSQSRGLILTYIGGCGYEVGAVYGRDFENNLNLGILQRYSSSPCKKPAKEVSLYQPFDSRHDDPRTHKIFPMRIEGATYF